jgi:hypothetical protein
VRLEDCNILVLTLQSRSGTSCNSPSVFFDLCMGNSSLLAVRTIQIAYVPPNGDLA